MSSARRWMIGAYRSNNAAMSSRPSAKLRTPRLDTRTGPRETCGIPAAVYVEGASHVGRAGCLKRVRAFWAVAAALWVTGCFDPLYQLEPGALWSACCRDGAIDTCECADMQACSFEIRACVGGTCVEQGSCQSGTGGSGGGSSGTG